MEFLDFLLIIVFAFYVIRAIIRLVMPMVFQKVMNKAQQQQQNAQQNYTRAGKPEGIQVDYIPPSKKGSVPDSEGDFVDYEEVK